MFRASPVRPGAKDDLYRILTSVGTGLKERREIDHESVRRSLQRLLTPAAPRKIPVAPGEIAPRPFTVMRVLRIAGKAVDAGRVSRSAKLRDEQAAVPTLDMLERLGLVERSGPERRLVYSPVTLAAAQWDRIMPMLEEYEKAPDTDLTALKTNIAVYLDFVWAKRILKHGGEEGLAGAAAKASSKKIILGIETDWVPGAQEAEIQSLARSLQSLESLGNIIVVRAPADRLAAEIREKGVKEKIMPKNVIVFASSKTIMRPEFNPIRAAKSGEKNKAFMVGVNAEGMSDDQYIRFCEMLSLTMELALGDGGAPRHRWIEIEKRSDRLYAFTPQPEFIDLREVGKIHALQRKILTRT